jgi:cell division protein FtsL
MTAAKASPRRSRAPEAAAVFALLAACFAMLLLRLEVLRKGYELSALRETLIGLEQHNRALKLEVAKLSSTERLRALAAKYGMAAPAPAQTVVAP